MSSFLRSIESNLCPRHNTSLNRPSSSVIDSPRQTSGPTRQSCDSIPSTTVTSSAMLGLSATGTRRSTSDCGTLTGTTAFKDTTDFQRIKEQYYWSRPRINPSRIVPVGPVPSIRPLDEQWGGPEMQIDLYILRTHTVLPMKSFPPFWITLNNQIFPSS